MDKVFEICVEQDIEEMAHCASAAHWNVESSAYRTLCPISGDEIVCANSRDGTALSMLQGSCNTVVILLDSNTFGIKSHLDPVLPRGIHQDWFHHVLSDERTSHRTY